MLDWLRNKKEKVLIFGAGAGGVAFYEAYHFRYNIIGFLDNNLQRQGNQIYKKPVFSPVEVHHLMFDLIIIASDYYKEIYEQLTKELVVNENKIKFFHSYKNNTDHSTWWQCFRKMFKFTCLKLMCKKQGIVSTILYFIYRTQHADNIRLIPLMWLDQCDDNKIHVFREAAESVAYGPRFLKKNTVTKTIILPAISLFRFRGGTITTVMRYIRFSTDKVILERIPTVSTVNADYSFSSVIFHGKTLALVREEAPQNISKGLLINGFNEANYYHLMLEVMSQLQFVNELPLEFSDYPILLSMRSYKIPAIKQFIERVLAGKKIIFLDSLNSYQVDDLLLMNMPNAAIPNLKEEGYFEVSGSYCREESISFIRNIGYDICQKKTSATPERIFLARKAGLRAYNQDEILKALAPLGFVSIYFEDIDFCEQVSIMSGAKIVVGPTGAAWTNLIFAKPKTKALCWMAEEIGNFSCFSNLAAISGVDLDYLTYQAGTKNSRELYYHAYDISVEDIIDWIKNQV